MTNEVQDKPLIEAKPLILVTGATGYIGGRLVPRLIAAGYRVRAAGRSLDKLRSRDWANSPNVELAEVDLRDRDSITAACAGCSSAFYLVHSMNPSAADFAAADRTAAENMVAAAEHAGLKRMIYLGGLGEASEDLSKHLRSRAEVGTILRGSSVPVTILRAGMIIGSGSASFEILRYLVERLPIMITPRWIETPSQPIAVRNVLHYLIACLSVDETIGRILDIGGPEVITYRKLMELYAEEAHIKKRLVVPVPVFTPRLSSYWIHYVTPVPSYIARPLAEGLRNPALCQNNDIQALIPQTLVSCRDAIAWAIEKREHHGVETHWSDAGRITPAELPVPGDPAWAGGACYQDSRRIIVESPVDLMWERIIRIGGTTGWYYANWLWMIRGLMDRMVGGVGLGRGRRDELVLRPGDFVDFWRVVAIEPNKRLLLSAEMKLPGKALLEFSVRQLPDGKTEISQIATYVPKGLPGLLYWWAVTPLHNFVFAGMLRGIATADGSKIARGPERIPVGQG